MYNGGFWEVSKKHPDAIISNMMTPGSDRGTGHDDVEYYGGYVICESVQEQNRQFIADAPRVFAIMRELLLGLRGSGSIPVNILKTYLDGVELLAKHDWESWFGPRPFAEQGADL